MFLNTKRHLTRKGCAALPLLLIAASTIFSSPLVSAAPSDANPIDDARFFVTQHYQDFLDREPDPEGLAFWTNEIALCGSDVRCVEAKRVSVSAAFFLSIELQQTGFFAYRLYKAASGERPSLEEYLYAARVAAEGIVVGAPGWEQKLEANRAALVVDYVDGIGFQLLYGGMSDAQYVDALVANTGVAFSQAERDALVLGLASGAETRATTLRRVVENQDFSRREFNPAFVLMQYYGYLRRDLDEEGYEFWLRKLEEFGGDFRRAEMVKAFIASEEYRVRFGER